MSGDFYSYLNSHNLGHIKPQVSSVSSKKTDTKTRFSESSMRSFAKKWLNDQGCECWLSDDTGFRPHNNAVITVEGVAEEDKERVTNLLQDLVDAIEDSFGESTTFSKSNELPSCEEEFRDDGVPLGTFKATVSYDFQPYCDDDEVKPSGDDADEKAKTIALLKSSGAI